MSVVSKKKWRVLSGVIILGGIATIVHYSSSDDGNQIPVSIEGSKSDVAMDAWPPQAVCNNPQKLMPHCDRCIPGLDPRSFEKRCELNRKTRELRENIFAISAARNLGNTCRLYPYLSTDTISQRQVVAGQWIDDLLSVSHQSLHNISSPLSRPRSVLDIGPYTNPMAKFMKQCPARVDAVEPCGELARPDDGADPWLSRRVSCPVGEGGRGEKGGEERERGSTQIQNIFPILAQKYVDRPDVPHYGVVVCIGCDGNFGPSWADLMKLQRPFHLILEWPTHYTASANAYATKDRDGCTVVKTQYFNFSDCPDCGFKEMAARDEEGNNSVRYASYREMRLFDCASIVAPPASSANAAVSGMVALASFVYASAL